MASWGVMVPVIGNGLPTNWSMPVIYRACTNEVEEVGEEISQVMGSATGYTIRVLDTTVALFFRFHYRLGGTTRR